MKKLSLFLWLLLPGCKDSPESEKKRPDLQEPVANSRQADSAATVRIVTDFFHYFDKRDLKKMNGLLLPETKIVHHNGAVTNTAEMIQVIKETKNWWPRTRQLSDFEFISAENLAVLGLTNQVIFSLPGNKNVVEPYRETWVFQKKEGDWKTIRVHYSKITVDKHSEEVN